MNPDQDSRALRLFGVIGFAVLLAFVGFYGFVIYTLGRLY